LIPFLECLFADSLRDRTVRRVSIGPHITIRRPDARAGDVRITVIQKEAI